MLQGFFFFQTWDFYHCQCVALGWAPTLAPRRSRVFHPEDCQDRGLLAAIQPGKWREPLLSCPAGWTEDSNRDECEATAVPDSRENCCLSGLCAQLGCLISVKLAGMIENKLTLPLKCFYCLVMK